MSKWIFDGRLVRLLLVLGIVQFSMSSVVAQGVGGGISVAAVASQIDGDQWGGFNKWGYQFGGFATYHFNERISMQIEILASHRGSREVQTAYSKIDLNFIDVPLLFQYHKELPSGGTLIGEGGLSANLLMSAKTGFKPFRFDQTENFRRLSSELHLGGAWYFSKIAGLYARWSLGLSNLNATPAARPWFTIHCVSAGFRFKFQ